MQLKVDTPKSFRDRRKKKARLLENAYRSGFRRFANPYWRWLRENMAYDTGAASDSTTLLISTSKTGYYTAVLKPKNVTRPKTEREKRQEKIDKQLKDAARRAGAKVREKKKWRDDFTRFVITYWWKAVSYYGVRKRLEEIWESHGRKQAYEWTKELLKSIGDGRLEDAAGGLVGKYGVMDEPNVPLPPTIGHPKRKQPLELRDKETDRKLSLIAYLSKIKDQNERMRELRRIRRLLNKKRDETVYDDSTVKKMVIYI